MAVRMNTFAVILLAFPFYLAVKGRLAGYIALAKPTSGAAASPPASASPTASASPAPAPAPAAPSGTTSLEQALAVASTFANTSGVGAAS